MSSPVYLDHNATTQPAPEVIAEMVDAMQRAWANPSSTHAPGQAARRLLADARARVANFLGAQASEVVFTSGATEANHMAVLGALASSRGRLRRRLVLSAVEHPGLLALAQRLADEGVPVDLIRVDAQGRLDLDHARALIRDDVSLVSVMGANNETGVCMPIAALAELARAHGAWLHVDATQLAGKSNLSFAASGADLMSVSAHKLAGPKGVGALLVRKGLPLAPLISGRQERHRRGGTENLPGIAGFAAACELAGATLAADIERIRGLRERLEQGLLRGLPGTHLYGAQTERLPNTACLRFADLAAEPVLARLERAGVVASSGAACSAGGTQPSHVLLAMGESAAQAKSGVRFSLGRETSAADIDAALDAVQHALVPLLDPQPLAA
ncbi:cysteine desulfurase [Rhizobacter sp. AJA081-3]|uniref:cysteine desulfurase family protein n=1 Tax=Rhizobacter sp. AJA081-3 TaxID=2753607 RepID=UPI001AE018DA|nr:cysteine desulfurase family protein [Rhizobacter sp. AJA081-3]QTN23216.1 cysteine desulfurase [Rhizobacter sp. AJA081-3]